MRIVLLGILALSACSTIVASAHAARNNDEPHALVSRRLCPAGPPKAVIRAYYAASVRGDARAVRACFSPSFGASFPRGNEEYAPWNNTASARVTRMRQRHVPVSYLFGRVPHFTAARLVKILVSVVVRYRRVENSSLHNGPNDLFIYVAKARPSSPWRILATGTGP